jgi:hypothetical protein
VWVGKLTWVLVTNESVRAFRLSLLPLCAEVLVFFLRLVPRLHDFLVDAIHNLGCEQVEWFVNHSGARPVSRCVPAFAVSCVLVVQFLNPAVIGGLSAVHPTPVTSIVPCRGARFSRIPFLLARSGMARILR